MMNIPCSILSLAVVAIFAYNMSDYVSAQSSKSFCYDQIGDVQFCFDTEKKCENQLKDDRIAESPCYNESLE